MLYQSWHRIINCYQTLHHLTAQAKEDVTGRNLEQLEKFIAANFLTFLLMSNCFIVKRLFDSLNCTSLGSVFLQYNMNSWSSVLHMHFTIFDAGRREVA